VPANGGESLDPSDPDEFPVPPDWIIADPEENKRRILAMLEQGDRDIAAGWGRDADEVFREADEIIAAAIAAKPTRS
jgi:hypothetical protein